MADVHLLPVGIDCERLFLPMTRGSVPADEIVLFGSGLDATAESEIADAMCRRLEYTFETVLGLPVTTRRIEDVYSYSEAYRTAYESIAAVLDGGDTAWINVSSMPRPVAFAFATAAHTLVIERPGVRERVHPYYVSPEEYLSSTMRRELRRQEQFLAELDDDLEGVADRRAAVREVLTDVEERGFTKGAKQLDGEGLYVEFPVPPIADLREFEGRILAFLYDEGPLPSTSELARQLAIHVAATPDDSFRSKVQYNVTRLEEKGYVRRRAEDNRYVTALTTMGELWVETHDTG